MPLTPKLFLLRLPERHPLPPPKQTSAFCLPLILSPSWELPFLCGSWCKCQFRCPALEFSPRSGHRTASQAKLTSKSGEWRMMALSSCYPDPPGHSLFLSFLGVNSSVFPWSVWSASYSFNIVLFAYVGQLVLLLTAKGPKLIQVLWSFFDASHVVDPSLLLSSLNLVYVSSSLSVLHLCQLYQFIMHEL